MNSKSAVLQRVGAQRPTHLLTPEGQFNFSDGDDAIELAESLGLVLLDWQRWLVRWILAVDAKGLPACSQVIIVVPRQNGKGAVLETVELYWLLVAGIPTVIHTAHETDTAAGHQARLESLTTEPEITIPSLRSYQANGKERIKNLDENLLLQFRTRTKATKRGASPQRVVLDECQELQDAHLSALVPSMAAQSMNPAKMPQLIYAGSAPLEHSQYMHALLTRVQTGKPAKTLLAMWACDPDVDAADVENWYRVNPSLGLLISEDFVRETEFLVLGEAGFLAERLGVPQGGPDDTTDAAIDLAKWSTLADGESMAVAGSERIALDAPQDRTSAVFSVAGKRSDNLAHVSVRLRVEKAGGLLRDQVIAQALLLQAEHKTRIILPPSSPAKAWRTELLAAGVELDELTTAEFAEACGLMSSLIDDGAIRHRGQADMTEAVAGLAVKPSGDVDVWSARKSSVNIAPFRAATCALVRVAKVVFTGDYFVDLDDLEDD